MAYSPLIEGISVVVLIVLILAFTPASTFVRLAPLPILAALSWRCVINCPIYIPRSSWAASVGGYTLASLLHYVDVGIISQWSYDLHGPRRDLVRGVSEANPRNKPPKQKSQFLSRLAFGLSVFTSWRFIDTPYEPRGVTLLKQKQTPSRSQFLYNTGITIVVCYLMLDLMDASADDNITAKFYQLDQARLFSRLGEVSSEELVMRFFAALGLGAGLISVQRGVYSLAAFFCVASGLHTPSQWPPFNGPFSTIYSLRSFWSVFWHQINTHRFMTISNFFLFVVLRLPKSWATRYLRVWTVFLASGLFHVAIDISSGINARSSGAIPFFLIQPLGIMVEDVVSAIAVSLGRPTGKKLSITERCISTIWFGLWMAWTAPAYLYPVLNSRGPGDAGVVPISIIGLFKGFVA